MAIKEIRRAQLVKGGDIIKQGETFTLGFLFFDANDRIIQLESSDGVTVKIANNTGVILETTAEKIEDRVEFSVNENIGYGEMRVEFTVTIGSEVQKYPASDWIRLKITPSLDDTGIGNVYAVTATEMFSRIEGAETKATAAETKAISAETTATNVQRDFDQILTEAGDSNPEIVAARLGEENLRVFNEKVTTQLADTIAQLAEETNDYSYTLGFLKNLNEIRTRAILPVNGFFAIDDGAEGKYRVLAVVGNETWQTVKDKDGLDIFQVSALGEIRSVDGIKKLKVMSKHGEFNVKLFGAKGDGVQFDTTSIQAAMDNSRGTLVFPTGNYRVTGTGEACLYLKRKVNLKGMDPDFSRIRSDGASSTTSILKVSITDNFGLGDVRNWKMEALGLATNVGGLHALLIKDGLQMLTCEITNNNLHASTANGGYSLYVENNLAHSIISKNTITHGAYMACYDANLIEKNLFSGLRVAVTYNLITGVYNNTVEGNTLVNRDGALHIINGSLVRFKNNQVELFQGTGISQSPVSAMVWVEGRDRVSSNVIIEENNLGGGTSLDHLIYVDNANKPVISKNQFVAVNVAEVRTTSKTKHMDLKQDNFVRSEINNPRTRTKFKAEVLDEGEGSVGVLKTLALANGWTGGMFYKDDNGIVNFNNSINGGATTNGTLMGTLPVGFRPPGNIYLPVGTLSGVGAVHIAPNGEMRISGNLPSNSNVTIPQFPTASTE